jgi:hypothetical protein
LGPSQLRGCLIRQAADRMLASAHFCGLHLEARFSSAGSSDERIVDDDFGRIPQFSSPTFCGRRSINLMPDARFLVLANGTLAGRNLRPGLGTLRSWNRFDASHATSLRGPTDLTISQCLNWGEFISQKDFYL